MSLPEAQPFAAQQNDPRGEAACRARCVSAALRACLHARLAAPFAECAAAKAKNIDVWTVTIGPSATSQMQSCATTTAQALYTTDGSGLSDEFKTIAKHLAMLRITK